METTAKKGMQEPLTVSRQKLTEIYIDSLATKQDIQEMKQT